MMYIILLIYFVNIVTGDDSSEAKYIDLLPEKEKEDFLETVARRIFDNIKHKNAIPEKDEHTKLIEKVLKEESLNLKRVSQNTSDDIYGKGNVVKEGDALDLTQDGKRNKRNSLKENKNSDSFRVQRASKETNVTNFNELSKELGVSDTEDIEVKHTNNKQTEVSYIEITTESNVEGIGTEITVEDLISKENSSVRDASNYDQERKTTKSSPRTSKPEEIRGINEDAFKSIETAMTSNRSYSTTEKINITSRRNHNSEPTNDFFEKNTEQEPVAITVKTSLSTSPELKLTEQTSEESVKNNVTKGLATNAGIKPEEKNVGFANEITKIVTASPEMKATETTTILSYINKTRKAYDKLNSNFDTDNITLDDIRDDRDNQGSKVVIDDKTLTTKTVVTANNVKLDDNYFDDESTAAAVDKNHNHTYLNDLAISIKENYELVTEKLNSTNSVDSENKDIKSIETIVNGIDNNNETIIKVIKNSKDYIKKKHSIKENAVNSYNGTTLENNMNSMAQNSNVIVKRNPAIITTTIMGTLINNNKKINLENSTEKTKNKSNKITDVEATMKSNQMRNGPETVKATIKKILTDGHKEIETKNNIAVVFDINNNKTEANYEEVIAESITIKHDNSEKEKTKSSSAEIKQDKNIIEKFTIENNESTTSESYTETTTVKIETDGIHAEATMKSNQMKNGPEIVKSTSKNILIDGHKEIQKKNTTAVVSEINNNKIETNYKEAIGEGINITIKHDNSAEKTKSNSAEIKQDNNIIEKFTIGYNENTTSETYTETTTVKIETLTVANNLNKSEANDKDFKLKEYAKPYINQDEKSITQIPKINHESVKVIDNDYNKMGKNLEKMEKISANFVNDMIKVLRASFSDKPNQDLKPLRLSDDNPKPKEYKVYKAPNTEPLDQNNGAKYDNVIEENPYYVPVYNYGAEHAYYNPKNRLGPNADDDDVTIIKNDGYNVESIAQDYDSIIKDNGYFENDYTKNYQKRQDLNDIDARNDVDYDEAYNKEREFIDRMGDIRGNIITTNENLRSRDTENTQNLKKVEYMKNLVKIYKNRNGKHKNKQKSLGRYKLNLPIVVNYPKYSDIIMNSHDYLDIDYRYPAWKKPKKSRSRKHRLIRTNGNNFPKDIIITSFADDPDGELENTAGVANPNSDDKYKDDSYMLPDETQNQETEKPYKIIYDDDYEDVKKPFVNHYGKTNSINLFESGEYVWETQDTKEKRNKKKNENEKSQGIKNQIRKIREMMYSSANFGLIKSKEVEENNYHGIKDFIKEAPKMCDGEDPSCIEPFILINKNHMHKRKQTESARHAMNNSLASDYFIARTNNASDSIVEYIPKLSARTQDFTFDNSVKNLEQQHFRVTWITDFSQIHDQSVKSDCSFCSDGACHTCVCGQFYKFCIIPEKKPSDDDNKNDHDIPTDTTKPTENPTNEDISTTTVGYYWDTVKNISMLPSYLDPIANHNHEEENKLSRKKKPKYGSRNDNYYLPSKNFLREGDASSEDNSTVLHVAKPNIMKFNSPDKFQDPDNPYPPPAEDYDTAYTKTDKTPEIIQTTKPKYYNIDTIKSIMEIIPDDVELMLKVTAMLENQTSEEKESGIKEKELQCLRSVDSIDLESYVSVLQDMVDNQAKGLIQYDWMGTSIDIQAAVFKLKEMTESVKNNEILDNLDFKLLKYFTFLHKFSTKKHNDLRMFLPKPKYKYNRTRSQKGVYSRIWLKRRLKKFAFEVSGIDLYYFVEFLEELQFYLYDLHTALTQIALVTSYKNQNWFKNLSELYLENNRKNILELLLHLTTVRLLDLVENSVQSGLQDGFLKYVMNNEKETEKSKNELVLILNIIEELKTIQ